MSQSHQPWNADCLNVITVLAISQEAKKLKRLARRFGLNDKVSDPEMGDRLQFLHEVFHRDTDLANTLKKELDERFRSTVTRVRSLEAEQLRQLSMDWLPNRFCLPR